MAKGPSPQQQMQLVKSTLTRYQPTLAAVTDNPKVAEAFVRLALVACSKNPQLLSCSPNSIALSVLRAAQLGLDIGTTAHVVPFSGTAQLVVDYRGYVELMVGYGGVVRVEARCVYEDELEERFDVEYGTSPHIYHKPILRNRIAKDGAHEWAVKAYAVAYFADGSYKFEIMDVSELEAARAGKGGPWIGSFRPEMEKKTALRRLAKTIPQSPRLKAAYELENRVNGWGVKPNAILDEKIEVEAIVLDEEA